MTGSLAILSEAAHSLIDLAATVMTYFAVRISGKPADAEHHYGHGKVESVSALAETALLFVLAGVVIWEAAKRLLERRAAGGRGDALGVRRDRALDRRRFLSRARALPRRRRRPRATRSKPTRCISAPTCGPRSRCWSGSSASRSALPAPTPVAAVVVAILICIAGWRLGRRTIETLTDTAPAGAADKITADRQRASPAWSRSNGLRVRQVGDVLFVDLVVAVSRTLPLDRVAALKERIVEAVRADSPAAEITVTTEPRALDDETVLERVMVIARNRSLAVHHVTVHAIEGRLAVSLDLEVDGALSLGAAHDIATGLEEAIREELGPEVEVETHIEPLQPFDEPGRDASAERVAAVREALDRDRGKGRSRRRDPRRARARSRRRRDRQFSLPGRSGAHGRGRAREGRRGGAGAARLRFPSIKRVIGHAEPAPPRQFEGSGR